MAIFHDRFSVLRPFAGLKADGTAIDNSIDVLLKYKGLKPKDLYLEQFKIIGDINYGTCKKKPDLVA